MASEWVAIAMYAAGISVYIDRETKVQLVVWTSYFKISWHLAGDMDTMGGAKHMN